MKWRISDDEYNALDADRQADYEREGDNGYVLAVIDEAGERVKPPEEVGPLRRAYEATKRERDQTREELAAIRADAANAGSRAQVELLETRLRESEARIAQIAIDGQAALDAMDAKREPLLAGADAKTKTARSTWDKAVLDYGLADVIRGAGGAPELLQGKLEKFCRVEHDPETDEARIVVVDDNGVRRDDPFTGQPISAAHALEELRLFDPRLQAAFTKGNGNGGGAPH